MQGNYQIGFNKVHNVNAYSCLFYNQIHSSMKDIIKHVDKQCLPLEFGGDIPSQTMIELWKEELAEKRQRLLSFDTMNLISAAGIITSKNSPTNDDTGIGSLPGSFRKLELD